MKSLFSNYADLMKTGTVEAMDPRLRIESDGKLEVYYAPFDHVNTEAKIVLVGITPGQYQANVSLSEAGKALAAGKTEVDASLIAKNAASFSGAMRLNLINQLNYFRINKWLGIEDCSSLFEERSDLVHFTSALRYPVFKNGKNYSGAPSIVKTPMLREMVSQYLEEEILALKNTDALYIPLGGVATEALFYLADNDKVKRSQIFAGIAHPSPANRERIDYMLERKPADKLSNKTRADRIDSARSKLKAMMEELLDRHPD